MERARSGRLLLHDACRKPAPRWLIPSTVPAANDPETMTLRITLPAPLAETYDRLGIKY